MLINKIIGMVNAWADRATHPSCDLFKLFCFMRPSRDGKEAEGVEKLPWCHVSPPYLGKQDTIFGSRT